MNNIGGIKEAKNFLDGKDDRSGCLFILLVLAIPPFAPPIVLLSKVPQPEWLHPLFRLILGAATIALVVYIAYLFYRHVPTVLSALLTAVYVGGSYGFVVHYMTTGGGPSDMHIDNVWMTAIVLFTGALGYLLGKFVSCSLRPYSAGPSAPQSSAEPSDGTPPGDD